MVILATPPTNLTLLEPVVLSVKTVLAALPVATITALRVSAVTRFWKVSRARTVRGRSKSTVRCELCGKSMLKELVAPVANKHG